MQTNRRHQYFKLVQRTGNELVFKSGTGYATEYRAEDLNTLIVYNGQTLREFLKEREKSLR